MHIENLTTKSQFSNILHNGMMYMLEFMIIAPQK